MTKYHDVNKKDFMVCSLMLYLVNISILGCFDLFDKGSSYFYKVIELYEFLYIEIFLLFLNVCYLFFKISIINKIIFH